MIKLFFAANFFGGFVQGTTGFGFALVTMSVLPFFINLTDLTLITIILGLGINFCVILSLRGGVNFKIMLPPLIMSVIGRQLGTFILLRYDTQYLRYILSMTIIIISLYFLFWGNFRIKPNWINGGICGTISGILGGLYGLPGPPLVIYYFSALEQNREYNATTQATMALSSFYSIFLHYKYGNITPYVIRLSLIGIVAVSMGSLLGAAVFKKINRESLKKAIYTVLILIGLTTLLNGI